MGGVFDWLLDEGVQHRSLAVAKKSLALLDTVLAQNSDLPFLDRLHSRQDKIVNVLVGHVRSHGADSVDTDEAEKALRLVNRFLSLRPVLFASGFRRELANAVQDLTRSCELSFGADNEICEGLAGLARQT